jgi:hypothetical protein
MHVPQPLYYLLPPTSLSAVLVAAADSMAAPFAAFPGDRLAKNFTRVASLDALEEALLGYVSARRAHVPDGLPYGYDSVVTPYSGLQVREGMEASCAEPALARDAL